jgi:isochorismate synthase EntC
MQWFSSGARIFAGGGIIAGSDATSEWEETEIKIQSIRQVSAS